MNRTMLRAKIHRIRVTECDVEYEGSLTLDTALMEAADLVPFERVEVYNIDNANRFATYLIEGPRGRGQCCVNGAAAHLVNVGDKLILAAYTEVDEADVATHELRVVLVGADNRIQNVKRDEHAGVKVN